MALHAVQGETDWRETLLRLCQERADLIFHRSGLDEGIESLNDDIKTLLQVNGVETVEVPGFKVALITSQRSSLSAERLLELGVTTSVLTQATTMKPSVALRVTEMKG